MTAFFQILGACKSSYAQVLRESPVTLPASLLVASPISFLILIGVGCELEGCAVRAGGIKWSAEDQIGEADSAGIIAPLGSGSGGLRGNIALNDHIAKWTKYNIALETRQITTVMAS